MVNLNEMFEHHILDHTYATISIFGFPFNISKHMVMMWIASFILIAVMPLIIKSNSKILRPFKNLIYMIVIFIREDIVKANFGEEGLKYTPYFCTLFFFIILMNLAGLVPFSATATGNISVTIALALTSFIFINYIGIKSHGLGGYLKSLVPQGVPAFILPLLYPLEVISLFVKAAALCIRLFANMIAGHIVLLAFIGMIFIFAQLSQILTVAIVVPFETLLSLFVYLLEIFVAVLQAYIFTVLTAIFASSAMHSH